MLASRLMIDDDAHDVAGAGAEQPIGDDVEHAALHRRQFADREHVQIQHVEQQVDRDDGGRAERERQRHVAPGIADLLGHVGGGVPARVGEHHGDEREQPVAGRPLPARRRRGSRTAPVPNAKPESDEQQKRRDLQRREHVAHDAAGPDAADVNAASSQIDAIATIVCVENVSGR